MNIPESAIKPFGVIGIPSVKTVMGHLAELSSLIEQDAFIKELISYAEMLMSIGVDIQTISESVCDLATTLGAIDLTIEYFRNPLSNESTAFFFEYSYKGVTDKRLFSRPRKLA
jgi:hypothetical protein